MTNFKVYFPVLVILCGFTAYSPLTKRRRRIDYPIPHNVVHKDLDLISELPDDILVSIIARLPTRNAVATSILSKRWRNLYKSMSNFSLRCIDLQLEMIRGPHYSVFELVRYRVERLLHLCSHSKIHFFKLQCCLSESNNNELDQCIYDLGKSGVEELHLSLSCGDRVSRACFPCYILPELSSLRCLTLRFCNLSPNLEAKCSSLQTLALEGVEIVPGFVECILSNCLSLSSLSIEACICPHKLCFRGGPLKTLRIYYCAALDEIELHAANLSLFGFRSSCHKGVRVPNFIFGHVPQLQTIYICHEVRKTSVNRSNVMPYVFGQLPNQVPGIEFLLFDTEGDFYQESTSPWAMRTFGNLRRLDITVCCTSRTNLLALTPYLERCPVLEELHLNLQNMFAHNVAVERKAVSAVHEKLKKVEISGFCCTNNEMEFALYILRSAVALEQLCITAGLKYYLGCGIWFTNTSFIKWTQQTPQNIRRILRGQASSATAKLIFRHKALLDSDLRRLFLFSSSV